MSKLCLLTMIILLSSQAIALDLSHYPDPFIKKGKFDAVLAIGDRAAAEDVVGITDIAMSLQFDLKVSKTVFRAGCGEYQINDLVRIDVGAVKLASKALADFKEQNLIVIGGPCANPIAATLLGHPEDCSAGFEYGKAVIKLYEHKDTSKYTLFVAGLLAQDTRAAAQVLANYQDYEFQGTELVVSDTSKTRPKVTLS